MKDENHYLIPWYKDKLDVYHTEVLILGSGIAGLYAAIKLNPKFDVTVLTKMEIMASNTEHAQGGIAVALNNGDSPQFHYDDTINAGAGLVNKKAAMILAEKGPECVTELIQLGTKFDTNCQNQLDFAMEGAHGKHRVLHAQGDATGWEIERTLVEVVQSQNISVKENYYLVDIVKNQKQEACGTLVYNHVDKKLELWLAKAIIMATGGLGQMYKYTTNPSVATGDGIAAAYRAGAELMDMEFMQFHPTALQIPGAPSFLISEAVRGEGAILINACNERFMENIPRKELAPRDVVSRAIWEQMQTGTVFLDFSTIGKTRVEQRFPGIHKTCLEYGVDITSEPVPVGPAAHYLMGGIRTDEYGQTNIPNLYACGECACNGVHGANRLASNSLLDGLVFAATISEHITAKITEISHIDDIQTDHFITDKEQASPADIESLRKDLKELFWNKVGIIRDNAGLIEARAMLNMLKEKFEPRCYIEELELGNMLTLGSIIIMAALEREESRGAHFRRDYPKADECWQKHSVIKRGDKHVCYVSI
ncbi:L-aspartate oxidase [Dehalobacter sp. DCM]|uniref:L-aspartate oxidase n=1 Tax=Dehalobacter sp. DCM TaxID=2907827 RepID=UPI0030819F87|nr:L-aspartate oxidase [Dehalobacter sp. DCM]